MTLLEDVFNVLSKSKIRFVYLRNLCGQTDGEIIELDPRHDPMITAIHEAIHCVHPEWEEDLVRRKEVSVISRMKIIDFIRLAKIVGRRVKGECDDSI